MRERSYQHLVFSVQALRRVVDRDALALCGALGVAAQYLPHQLGNVQRILSAPRIRHLLADEVGMGKMVQALMILNALRLQDPALRVLIVVPDALAEQWRDELLARAHQSPAEDETADEERRVRLVWPQVLADTNLIDPDRYGLLIVDEFHALTRAMQGRILRTAPSFTQLLLITATPALHDPQRLGELLRMLEPSRAALLAPSDEETPALPDALLDRERAVLERLSSRAASEEESVPRLPAVGPRQRTQAALAHCTFRSVVRARRRDYREYMPLREHVAHTIEPLETEVRRQQEMWRILRHIMQEGESISHQFDVDLLAQRAIRSAASLRSRLPELRNHLSTALVEELSGLLAARQGDSRLDALCDLLTDIWSAEPGARVLIAAGDNPTVDELADRLPRLLERASVAGERQPVRVQCIRNREQGAQNLADTSSVDEAVRAFARGDADVLLAASTGQIGLNLQYSRHIILYSVPWSPQDLEQWIGRIDRIGNVAADAAGAELPIAIHTITQRGQVDERIVDVMKATTILEHSISLDSNAVAEISESIREVALSGHQAQWQAVLRRAAELRAGDLDELGSVLLSALPWSAEQAKSLHRYLREAKTIEPALIGPEKRTGLQGREEALIGWLQELNRAAEYEIRFRWSLPNLPHSLKYRVTDRPDARGRSESRYLIGSSLLFSDDLIDKNVSPKKAVYFLAKRTELSQPPRREHVFKRHEATEIHPLRFLDHGSPLHDELVEGWLRIGQDSDERVHLLLPHTHPAYEALNGKAVVLWIGDADPARLLSPPQDSLAAVCGDSQSITDLTDDPRLTAARLADERLLRMLMPRMMLCLGAQIVSGGTVPLDQGLVYALLNPFSGVQAPTPKGSPWTGIPPWVEERLEPAWDQLAERARGEVVQSWSHRRPQLSEALADRLLVLSTDADDDEAVELLRQEALEHAAQDIEKNTVFDERTRRLLLGRVRGPLSDLRESQELRRLSLAARQHWLEEVLTRLEVPEVTQYRRLTLYITGLRAP